jgi:TonB family protein
MTPAQALSVETIWQQWERRIVNARFPLLQYLGGSRYSAFYLTEFSGTKAAIKLIPAGTPRTAAQVACWKIAGRLSHPNLLRILDAGLWHADQEQDMYFAVMEHCDESLADLLRERQLSPAEARDVLNPTLGVLKYLHSHGLLHGQIKPAHLLACGDQLKLSCDTIHRNGEGHPSAIESPYDAPEKSAGTISLSGDVWSLGITLYEALTGHLPGAGKTSDAKVGDKLPAPFDAIVCGCLARGREQRLSLSAIRAIMDKPVKESAAEPRAASQGMEKVGSNLIVLPAVARAETAQPSTMEVLRAAPVAEKPAPAADNAVMAPKMSASAFAAIRPVIASVLEVTRRRKNLAIGAAVAAVLAIMLVLWFAHKTPDATPATVATVSHPTTPVAPTTTNPRLAELAPRSASVLNQVAPVVVAYAQNTIHGTVKVKVLVSVDADGRVSRAKLASRGPSSYFAKQSLDAARRWTFTPAIKDGKPQPSEWAIHFEFRRGGNKATATQTSRG